MTRRVYRWISAVLVLASLGVLFLLVSEVYADEGHGHDHHDDGGDTIVDTNVATGDLMGGDTNVSTGGNRALALSNSLGDVDIAACMGSVQWASPLFSRQRLVLNQVCMAEFYLNSGQYELAAMMLCNVPEILKEFDTEASCEDAHNFRPPAVEEVATPTFSEHDEDIEQVQIAQNSIASRIEDIEAKLNRPAPKPRVIEKTVVEQKPFLSDSKRAALQAILEEEE